MGEFHDLFVTDVRSEGRPDGIGGMLLSVVRGEIDPWERTKRRWRLT
jgi:hypothetical protein